MDPSGSFLGDVGRRAVAVANAAAVGMARRCTVGSLRNETCPVR